MWENSCNELQQVIEQHYHHHCDIIAICADVWENSCNELQQVIEQHYHHHCDIITICADVWENACNELQRMLIVRSLRPDRVSFCVTSFITNNLGSSFVEPPVLNMVQVLEDSTCRTPLIFVLSAGVVGSSHHPPPPPPQSLSSQLAW